MHSSNTLMEFKLNDALYIMRDMRLFVLIYSHISYYGTHVW